MTSVPAGAQAIIKLGAEFQVPVYTLDGQIHASVRVGVDGGFVIVWDSDRDGNSSGIFARRFGPTGAAIGGEFQVNSYTTGQQSDPVIGMSGNGAFVVLWSSLNQDGSAGGIFGRRFNAAGVGQSIEFQVNTYTLNAQRRPDLDMNANGTFVVAWDSDLQDNSDEGIFAKRFDAAGVAVSSEFMANTYTNAEQSLASVGVDATGDFVIAWYSLTQDGDGAGLFGQRFGTSGNKVGGEFQINVHTTNSQTFASVDLDDTGDFVVSWRSLGQDGSSFGAFARRFDALAVALGGEFQIDTYTSSGQGEPVVHVQGDGDFVIAWQSIKDGDAYGSFVKRWTSAGVLQGTEFQTNTFTIGSQAAPSVDGNNDGRFVVAWYSTIQDGSSYGVFAQRFGTLSVLDVDANGTISPLTDGLLTLRWEFGFTGAALTTGAVDLEGCTRCNAAAIEAFLNSLK